MKTFSYNRAANLDDALSQLGAGDQPPVMLAGGTDLLTLMKADIASGKLDQILRQVDEDVHAGRLRETP